MMRARREWPRASTPPGSVHVRLWLAGGVVAVAPQPPVNGWYPCGMNALAVAAVISVLLFLG